LHAAVRSRGAPEDDDEAAPVEDDGPAADDDMSTLLVPPALELPTPALEPDVAALLAMVELPALEDPGWDVPAMVDEAVPLETTVLPLLPPTLLPPTLVPAPLLPPPLLLPAAPGTHARVASRTRLQAYPSASRHCPTALQVRRHVLEVG